MPNPNFLSLHLTTVVSCCKTCYSRCAEPSQLKILYVFNTIVGVDDMDRVTRSIPNRGWCRSRSREAHVWIIHVTLIARLGTKFMVVSDPELAEEVCSGDPMRRWTNMVIIGSKIKTWRYAKRGKSFRWRGSWKMSGWCLWLFMSCIYIWKGLWSVAPCCTWVQWPARFTKDMQNVPGGDLISKLFGNGSLARWFGKVRFGEINLQELHTGIGNSCQVCGVISDHILKEVLLAQDLELYLPLPSISFHQELPLMSSESSTSWIMITSVSLRFEVCSLRLRRIADGKSPTTFWKLPSPSGAWKCDAERFHQNLRRLSWCRVDLLKLEAPPWNPNPSYKFGNLKTFGFVSLI